MASSLEKPSSKGRILLYVGIALFIVAAGFSYGLYPGNQDKPLDSAHNTSYTSGSYGITFLYPSGYKLTEHNLPHPIDTEATGTLDHEIILTKKGVNIPAGSDGSPSIVIQMFENEPEYLSASDFIHDVTASNYNLSKSEAASTTRGRYSGLEYSWSGLYEGRSFVVARRGFIYVFSIVGGNEDPSLEADYEKIMKTVSLAE